MPYHTWGDEDFNWSRLYEAMDYIGKFYFRVTGNVLLLKEKYGTIRYILLANYGDPIDALIVFKIAKRAIKRYPDLAGEIVDSLIPEVDDDYMKGFLSGVLYQATRGDEEWT